MLSALHEDFTAFNNLSKWKLASPKFFRQTVAVSHCGFCANGQKKNCSFSILFLGSLHNSIFISFVLISLSNSAQTVYSKMVSRWLSLALSLFSLQTIFVSLFDFVNYFRTQFEMSFCRTHLNDLCFKSAIILPDSTNGGPYI